MFVTYGPASLHTPTVNVEAYFGHRRIEVMEANVTGKPIVAVIVVNDVTGTLSRLNAIRK